MPKIYGADTINETSVGGGISAIYKFSTTTTIADPLDGYFRLNNVTPASVTTIAISKIDSEGFTRDGLSLLRNGDAILFSSTHQSVSQAYELTAEPVDNTTWYSFTVTNKLTNSSFGNHDKIEVTAVFSGASKYTELSDVPQSFTGDSGKLVAVNGTESGLEHRILTPTDIPNLDASKITTGVFDPSEIPNISATKITSDTITAARLGSGTADNTRFLRGDNTWSTSILGDITVNSLRLGRSGGGDLTNHVFGINCLLSNSTGVRNSAFGYFSVFSNTTGSYNVGVGSESLQDCTTGSYNTAIGADSGYNVTTGSGNILIGGLTNTGSRSPVFSVTNTNNRVVIGSTAVTNAYIQVAWTVVSDARDKTNFGEIPLGLDFVNSLKPVSYQYRLDRSSDEPNGAVRYGFKAQDILELEGENPVIIDNEDPEKLKFNNDSLVAVLVKSVQELTAMVKDLQAEINTLKGKA